MVSLPPWRYRSLPIVDHPTQHTSTKDIQAGQCARVYHNAVPHNKVGGVPGRLEPVEVGPKVDPMVRREDWEEPADYLVRLFLDDKVVFRAAGNRRKEKKKGW